MKRNLLTVFGLLLTLAMSAQNCSDLIISEYLEGSGSNKAIELYNASSSPINLGSGNYSMGRERNGNGFPMLLPITGVIEPFQTRVFTLDKRDPNGVGTETPVAAELQAVTDTFVNPIYVEANSPFYFNGDDTFYLIKNGVTLVDMVGKANQDPGGGWSVPGDPNTRWWTTDQTLVRKRTVLRGVSMSPEVFDPSLEWDSLPEDTFDSLGFHICDCELLAKVAEWEKGNFNIYPNPFAGGALVFKSDKQMQSFIVVSATGQMIREKEIINTFYHTVELPEVSPGVYMVIVEFEDGTRNYQKLIYR
jgi:hypothetical protein